MLPSSSFIILVLTHFEPKGFEVNIFMLSEVGVQPDSLYVDIQLSQHYFFLCFNFVYLFVILGLYLWPMEVPRPGDELEL